MPYTVKQLAAITAVSIRTLHWYDEIGLLKPAYHGSNGYRYYEDEHLFILKEIVFLKKLGISLADISELLKLSDEKKINKLVEHRTKLEQEIERKHLLISTIDSTLKKMKKNLEVVCE